MKILSAVVLFAFVFLLMTIDVNVQIAESLSEEQLSKSVFDQYLLMLSPYRSYIIYLVLTSFVASSALIFLHKKEMQKKSGKESKNEDSEK